MTISITKALGTCLSLINDWGCFGFGARGHVVDKIPKSKTTRDSCVLNIRSSPSSCLVVQQTRDLTECPAHAHTVSPVPCSSRFLWAICTLTILCVYILYACVYILYNPYICMYVCLQTCRLSRMCVTTVSLLSRVCLSRLWMTCLQFACWFVFFFFPLSLPLFSFSLLRFIKASCSANYKHFKFMMGRARDACF